MVSNLQCDSFDLSEAEMKELSALNINLRVRKGNIHSFSGANHNFQSSTTQPILILDWASLPKFEVPYLPYRYLRS
jgi:hypothetical protein